MFQRLAGAAAIVDVPLIETGGEDATTAAVLVAGDVKVIKDEGAAANITTLPTHISNGLYKIDLSAAEMTASRVAIVLIDQSAPKIWQDQYVLIDTYANPATALADAVWGRTATEPAAVPGWTDSFEDFFNFMVAQYRNLIKQTTTEKTLYENDGVTPIATAATADDGTTFTHGKWTDAP